MIDRATGRRGIVATLVRDHATRRLSRRPSQPCLGLLALIACSEPGPEHGPGSALPDAAGLRARGLSAALTLPDGRRGAVEIDAIEATSGRLLGLRTPVLDGFVLRGVRIFEDGAIVERRDRIAVAPYDGLLRARGRAEDREIETLGRLVAHPPPNRP